MEKEQWLKKTEGEVSDDELNAVTGGGCSHNADSDAAAPEPELRPGQTVSLCNSGHTFGSCFCNNAVCRSQVFRIAKQINGSDKYLLECMGCDWTYHAFKENIVIL